MAVGSWFCIFFFNSMLGTVWCFPITIFMKYYDWHNNYITYYHPVLTYFVMCYGDKVLGLIRPIANLQNAPARKLAKFLINNLPMGPATRHSLSSFTRPFWKCSRTVRRALSTPPTEIRFLESFDVATATFHPLSIPVLLHTCQWPQQAAY